MLFFRLGICLSGHLLYILFHICNLVFNPCRYPADLSKRAKIHSVLDWHHSNLRPGAGIILTSVIFLLYIANTLMLLCLGDNLMITTKQIIFTKQRKNIHVLTFLISDEFQVSIVYMFLFPFPAGYVLYSTLGPALGLPLNPEKAAESEKVLSASLKKIESVWLKGSGRFLVGSTQPSIADISLVCEIMQLEVRIYASLLSICSRN